MADQERAEEGVTEVEQAIVETLHVADLEVPSNQARLILRKLRSLPVEQRMEAMGMESLAGQDPWGRRHYVEKFKEAFRG